MNSFKLISILSILSAGCLASAASSAVAPQQTKVDFGYASVWLSSQEAKTVDGETHLQISTEMGGVKPSATLKVQNDDRDKTKLAHGILSLSKTMMIDLVSYTPRFDGHIALNSDQIHYYEIHNILDANAFGWSHSLDLFHRGKDKAHKTGYVFGSTKSLTKTLGVGLRAYDDTANALVYGPSLEYNINQYAAGYIHFGYNESDKNLDLLLVLSGSL